MSDRRRVGVVGLVDGACKPVGIAGAVGFRRHHLREARAAATHVGRGVNGGGLGAHHKRLHRLLLCLPAPRPEIAFPSALVPPVPPKVLSLLPWQADFIE